MGARWSLGLAWTLLAAGACGELDPQPPFEAVRWVSGPRPEAPAKDAAHLPRSPFAACRRLAPRGPLAEALSAAGFAPETLGVDEARLAAAEEPLLAVLRDELALEAAQVAAGHPLAAQCVAQAVTGGFDRAAAEATPVAEMIRHAARLLDPGAPQRRPAGTSSGGSFEEAVESISALYGELPGAPAGALPPDLEAALAPVLWAARDTIAARRARDEGDPRGPDWWRDHGGHALFEGELERPHPGHAPDRAMLARGRGPLYEAAANLAAAIEGVDWRPFIGRRGVAFSQSTPAGLIRILDGDDHVNEADGAAVLLHLDLGGDDVYEGEVASNRSGANAVSVLIDLAGADRYGYRPGAGPFAPEVPAHDADGRAPPREGHGAGPSRSSASRQGAARHGVAMLFDLGGDDVYLSLRASQGYAHQGVGVLFDAAGDDLYEAEDLVQGAALFGIGLAVDLGGGRDRRRAFRHAQGFGFSGGLGLLFDDGGDDEYRCDPGAQHGGASMYFSPQLPGLANTSLCQGAGFGARSDDPALALSGGLGVLRDAGGDDRYLAGVYAQGVGYWRGLGLLADGAGDDAYDVSWYGAGAGVHFGVGIAIDEGRGADVFGGRTPALHASLGVGHHYGVGVLLESGGDDTYFIPSLGGGAATCGGVGLFVDEDGEDIYLGSSPLSAGVATAGCGARATAALTAGLMIDGGGRDRYDFPRDMARCPAEGHAWGAAMTESPMELGLGLDVEGGTGVMNEGRDRGR